MKRIIPTLFIFIGLCLVIAVMASVAFPSRCRGKAHSDQDSNQNPYKNPHKNGNSRQNGHTFAAYHHPGGHGNTYCTLTYTQPCQSSQRSIHLCGMSCQRGR